MTSIRSKRGLCLCCGLLLGGHALAVPMLTTDTIWDFCGETLGHGSVSCEVAPAPDSDRGLSSLRLVFRKDAQANDWLDVVRTTGMPLDWRGEQTLELDVRTEQPDTFLWVKVMSSSGVVVLEKRLQQDDGKALAPNRWHHLSLPLPKDDSLKASVSHLSFYIPMDGQALPVGRPLTVHVGRVKSAEFRRVPWPPRRGQLRQSFRPVWSGRLDADAPWLMVGPPNNQSSQMAAIRDDAIEFVADRDGWNELAWSDHRRPRLAPNTTYRLDFDYEVIQGLAGRAKTFYSLIRCREAILKDVGWQYWQGGRGSSGHRAALFTTLDGDDYRIIFGIRDRGGIRIRNIRVSEVTGN